MRACAAILLLVTSWTFCSDRCVLIEFFAWNASPYDPLVASDVEDFLDEHPGTDLVAINNASSSDESIKESEHHNARRAARNQRLSTIMLNGCLRCLPTKRVSDFYLIRVNTPCALGSGHPLRELHRYAEHFFYLSRKRSGYGCKNPCHDLREWNSRNRDVLRLVFQLRTALEPVRGVR